MDFFHQFTPTHFVGLVAIACLGYVAKAVGRHLGKSMVELNENLKELNSTILKTDILWERGADVAMFRELEMRERRKAASAAKA